LLEPYLLGSFRITVYLFSLILTYLLGSCSRLTLSEEFYLLEPYLLGSFRITVYLFSLYNYTLSDKSQKVKPTRRKRQK